MLSEITIANKISYRMELPVIKNANELFMSFILAKTQGYLYADHYDEN